MDPEAVAELAAKAVKKTWADALELMDEDDPWNEDFDPYDYDIRSLLKRELALVGLRMLGAGGARFVVDLGDHRVLKLNLHPMSEELSWSEIENWQIASPKVRERILPLLGWGRTQDGFVWEIFPEAELGTVSAEEAERFEREWAELIAGREAGAATYDVGLHNLGRHEGRVVLFDYTTDI